MPQRERERDATAESRDLNVLQDPALGLLADGRVSPRVPHPERAVLVLVSGRALALPERALCAAAARLQTTTGGYVPLEDYAEGAAVVLTALEKDGRIS